MEPISSDRDARQIYIGTMSGTSLDGLDIVAVEFISNKPRLLHQQTTQYPSKLRRSLQSIALRTGATIDEMCQLDTQLGQFYATEIKAFINTHKINLQHILAIGSHGQTLRHNINPDTPYTLQIGDPNIIAAQTELTVVADFRRRDLALGGQGAPLAPAFHRHVFHSTEASRIIINIGGIANITHLPADTTIPVSGFDTGPGNTLLDHISQQYFNQDYDSNGEFARNGTIHTETLSEILKQELYFKQKAPKSTGTDYFSPNWLNRFHLDRLSPSDTLATLTELTAVSIANDINALQDTIGECFVCGGGAHNSYLLERLSFHLKPAKVKTTAQLGIHPDWVEAIAFAWLAKQTLSLKPGNLPSVTNSENSTILGGIYFSHKKF